MNINPYQSSAAPAEQVGFLAAPTRVRLLVVGIVTTMSVLLYLDRYALNTVTGAILTDLKLDEEQFGQAVGAFFLAYALMQVPCGWLSDTFGGRLTLALYVVGWSLATIALGFVNGLLAITMVRVLLGVTQAGAYPAAASLLKQWIPIQERASANGSVAMGGRVGALAAFALTPMLVLGVGQVLGIQTGRWRVVFIGYGLLGLVWAAVFAWFFRNSPREHRWCNEAEAKLVEAGLDAGKSKRTALPIVAMLTSKNLWLLSLSGILVNIGWIFLSGWLAHYLTIRFGTSLEATVGPKQVVAGFCTALTLLGGVCGSLFGGFIADACRRKFGPIWGRRIPGMAAGSLAACMYLLSQYAVNVWTFTAAMVLISFLVDLGLGSLWATYQDIGGRHVASVLGFANMCGNFGAAWFGYRIGALAKADQWNLVFLISAAALFGMAFTWLFVDPTQPITREEPTGL